jgi:hypothetical protein
VMLAAARRLDGAQFLSQPYVGLKPSDNFFTIYNEAH